ncbi:MAG: protein kinase domain-containing protein [Acidobacteriota bacterium]
MRRPGSDQTTAIEQRPDPQAPRDADDDTPLPDRFEAVAVIGRGGMGRVVRCLDRSLNREVAVKMLARRESSDARQRFLREARAIGTLHHPHIVTVHDVAPSGEYLVMELVEGESLEARLRRVGKLPAPEVHRIGGELLAALAAAHREHIVHRDVKPANILLDGRGTVKLTDFGIASFGDSDITHTGQVIGTPAYMAPEQLRGGHTDERADIYAAGATLFEAASGTRLFKDGTREPDPARAVLASTGDPVLAAAIEQAVRETPSERFSNAHEFALALARRPRSRRRGRVIAAAVVLAAAGGGALVLRARGASDDGAASATRVTIALLPFDDRVGDPRLDFAASGLPHLLGEQLAHVDRLDVLGYYRVRAHVTGAAAPLAAWRDAARTMGADVDVRGELTPGASGVRVSVIVEHSDGRLLDRIDREVPVDRIPATVEGLTSAIASTALGAPLSLAPNAARGFEIERELELGIGALERMDLATAREHLDAAVTRDDTLAEAHYYLAILDWWQQPPPEHPERHIERALAGQMPPAQHDFLVGLGMLEDLQYPHVVEYFRDLARRWPDDRDIQYGLFEALFHGGAPAEAMQVYRRLRELAPQFYVGIDHVLLYYTTRGDTNGMTWLRAHWDPAARDRSFFEARVLVAEQQYADAVRALERAVEEDRGAGFAIRRMLVESYAATGQLALALETNDGLAATDPEYRALAAYALHIARGEPMRSDDMRGLRDQARHAIELGIPDVKVWAARLDLVALDLPGGNADDLREDAQGRPLQGRIVGHDVGATMLAGALDDSRTLAAASRSAFPQVAATAEAIAAEQRGDPRAAITAWRRALDLNSDGRLQLLAWYALAADLRATGDRAGVIAACDEVILPRVFTWAWASTVATCLDWSAEAASALGRADDANRRWRSLLAIRTHAPADDELVHAARAALAAPGASR